MKIQTITVRPETRIEELAQKLIDSAAKRVIFVSGSAAGVLDQEINLRLLKYYAEEEDKEIGIQTADSRIQHFAELLDIPIFESDVAPPEASTVDPRRETVSETAAAPDDETLRPYRQQGGILIAIAAACFALVIGIWWLMQPTVTVTVYPKEKDLTISAPAQVQTTFTDRELSQGRIPGKIAVKEGSLAVHTVTTGRKTIGVTAAVGKATFINNSGQSIIVPKGSILISRDNCRFATSRDVLVPKKTAKTILGIPVGEEYGRVETEITAMERGTRGNQPAKAIQTIAGALQRSLKVINLVPTMNGIDKEVGVVAADDLKRSETEARRQMELAAPDELAAQVGPDYLFWPDLVRTIMIRNQFQPEIGMESATLTTGLDYRAMALVVSRVELHKYLDYILSVQTPAHFRPVTRSLEITEARAQKDGDFGARLQIEAKARIRGVLDPRQLQALIAGKDIAAAKKALTAADEIADCQFNFRRPMTRLPRWAFQIKVILPEGIAPR